VLISEARNAK